MRLFVAVHVPEEWKEEALRVASELSAGGADVKWVPPRNMHLTIKFLGEVEEGLLAPIKDALSVAAEGAAPFDAGLAGVGLFPPKGAPRVVWLGVSPGESGLTALARSVSGALEPLGFEPERRPFVPHLTIGRVRSPEGAGWLREAVKKVRTRECPRARIASVYLMESKLGGSAPVYSELGCFRLGGGAADGG